MIQDQSLWSWNFERMQSVSSSYYKYLFLRNMQIYHYDVRVVRLELGGAEVEEIAGGNEEEEVKLSNYDKKPCGILFYKLNCWFMICF